MTGLKKRPEAWRATESRAAARSFLEKEYGAGDVDCLVLAMRIELGLERAAPSVLQQFGEQLRAVGERRSRLDARRKAVVAAANRLAAELTGLERDLAEPRIQVALEGVGPDLHPDASPGGSVRVQQVTEGRQLQTTLEAAARWQVPPDLAWLDQGFVASQAVAALALARKLSFFGSPPREREDRKKRSRRASAFSYLYDLEPKQLAALECLATGTFDGSATRAASRVDRWENLGARRQWRSTRAKRAQP